MTREIFLWNFSKYTLALEWIRSTLGFSRVNLKFCDIQMWIWRVVGFLNLFGRILKNHSGSGVLYIRITYFFFFRFTLAFARVNLKKTTRDRFSRRFDVQFWLLLSYFHFSVNAAESRIPNCATLLERVRRGVLAANQRCATPPLFSNFLTNPYRVAWLWHARALSCVGYCRRLHEQKRTYR